jgi:hypothetical protein
MQACLKSLGHVYSFVVLQMSAVLYDPQEDLALRLARCLANISIVLRGSIGLSGIKHLLLHATLSSSKAKVHHNEASQGDCMFLTAV